VEKHDLIVVGGETIGLYLGLQFLKKGYQVAILEQKEQPGKKVCSGIVSSHLLDFFSPDEARLFIEKKYTEATLWINDQGYLFKGLAFLIDREKLNQFLIREIEKQGGKILFGQKVCQVEEFPGEVVVTTQNLTLHSYLVGGADGAFSRVRESLDLPPPSFFQGCIAFSEKEGDEDKVDLFFTRKTPGFFSWRIPRKENVEWGLALPPHYKPQKVLADMLQERGIQFSGLRSAFIPRGPIKKFTSRRVFLVGDAAGMVKPHTAGGLMYGLRAAQIASQVIHLSTPNPAEYEKEWRALLGKDILVEKILQKCYYLPSWAKKIGLRILSRIPIDQDHIAEIFFKKGKRRPREDIEAYLSFYTLEEKGRDEEIDKD